MTVNQFPVQSSLLCADSLLEHLRKSYSLPAEARCNLFHNHLNHIYQIKSPKGENDGERVYYFRVPLHGWRSRRDVHEEIELIFHLHRRQVPVALPVKSLNGDSICTITAPEGPRFAVMFHEAPGKPLDVLNTEHVQTYGRIVGRMHNCANNFNTRLTRTPLDLQYLLDTPLQRITRLIGQRREYQHFLRLTGEELHKNLSGLSRGESIFGICHGDLHNSNIHFDAASKPVLFDFDCFGYGWRAYDIAVFLYNLIIMSRTGAEASGGSAGKIAWMDIFNRFIMAYIEERPLEPEEFNAIKTFVAVRHLWGFGLNFQLHNHLGLQAVVNESFIDNNIDLLKIIMEENRITP